ncbi:hypothetical protein M9H77_00287 [Catharanthus roseus]|nr:hypothetical protein M9H77_00287 [Catharanthus roseus]
MGQTAVSAYEMADFIHCTVDLGLEDLKYMGMRYTWTNGQVWSKIDRAMCNQRWLVDGPYALADFLPAGCVSDHSPCIVHLFETATTAKRGFMFYNMWADHPNFAQLVEQQWAKPVYGTKQYEICRRLKELKGNLRGLNRQHFSHIQERARNAREELKSHQIRLQNSPNDGVLRELVYKLNGQATILSEAERKFCVQRTKKIWQLKDNLIRREGSAEQAAERLIQWSTQGLDGKFGTAAVYESLKPKGRTWVWHKVVWIRALPPKFSFIFWIAILNRLPTKDKLPFLEVDQQCALCKRQLETANHLFFECSFAAQVWMDIKQWAGLRRCMATIKSSLRWILRENGGTSWKSNMRKLCLAATIYYIWKARNQAVFEQLVMDSQPIIRKIKIQVYKIVFNLYPHILIFSF